MVAYRILRPDDARELAILHAATFETPWSPAALRSELAKPTVFGMGICAAETPERIASFVLFQRALDEAEMLTLATDPPHQKRSFASAVLTAAFDSLRERGVTRCLLDVAADNDPALRLYRKLGFSEDGRRHNYYHRAGEEPVDAILMSSDLTRL